AFRLALAESIFSFYRVVLVANLLAALSLGASLFVLDRVGIILYGLRTNFFHLPLIFLIPKVFTKKDVIRVGTCLLLLSVPVAILVAWQFVSPSGAWVNAAAGGDLARTMISPGSHIRPAG